MPAFKCNICEHRLYPTGVDLCCPKCGMRYRAYEKATVKE